MKKMIFAIVALGTIVYAGECFTASGKAFSDGQTIRKIAKGMGWKVGKISSVAAGTFIKGKTKLYPQGSVEVCIKSDGAGSLQFKAQSSASDSEQAEWRMLPANKR